MSDPLSDSSKSRLPGIHSALCGLYGCPVAYFHTLDPVSELVSSLLSHRTRNADSGKAFKVLKAAYPDRESVRDAPVADIQAAIRAVTWPEQKAPRIQSVLHELTLRLGTLSLDFLKSWPAAEARAWLESITGIGPKTSAAILIFSRLRMRALPVDSHHHRVALRLGLIPVHTPVGISHAMLEAMLPDAWDAQAVYDHHEVMMFHGQRCCFHARPACSRCPLLPQCPAAKEFIGRPADEKQASADAGGVTEPDKRRAEGKKPCTR